MDAPLISIIIPIYNHTKALGSAIASILRQSYKRVEVIIVDDGSTENFDISKFRVVNLPVKLVRQSHSGAPAARNHGFRESAGEYVIFWDADVIGESNMLQNMLNALQGHVEASYTYSNFYFGRKKMSARAFDADALKKNNFIHSTSLIRRSAVLLWDETLTRFQDWDMWLTMVEKGRVGVWIPEYLFRAVPHRGGMSAWLPRFAYLAPWRYLPVIRGRVISYETAKGIIQEKHCTRL